MIHLHKRLLPREDEDVCEALQSVLEDEGIELVLDASTKRVSGKSGDSVSIVVEQNGTEKALDAALNRCNGRSSSYRNFVWERSGALRLMGPLRFTRLFFHDPTGSHSAAD